MSKLNASRKIPGFLKSGYEGSTTAKCRDPEFPCILPYSNNEFHNITIQKHALP